MEFRIQSVPGDQPPSKDPAFERPQTTPVDPGIVFDLIEQIVDRELDLTTELEIPIEPEYSPEQTAPVLPDDADDYVSQRAKPRPPTLEKRLNDLQGRLMRAGIVRKGLEPAVRSLQQEVASLRQDVDNLSRRVDEPPASAPVELPTPTEA
jgi:hypothetical protein